MILTKNAGGAKMYIHVRSQAIRAEMKKKKKECVLELVSWVRFMMAVAVQREEN